MVTHTTVDSDKENEPMMSDKNNDTQPNDYTNETDPDELHAVITDREDQPVVNSVHLRETGAVNALTEISDATLAQSTTLHRGEHVTVDGREFILREYPARYPYEDRAVELQPNTPVKQPHQDARKWRYVFAIRDWTENSRLDEDGRHAILTAIYAPAEDAPPAGPEGYASVAVNGAVRVPGFVRNALTELLEIEGFGRPPFIPERDGEPTEPEPHAVRPGEEKA